MVGENNSEDRYSNTFVMPTYLSLEFITELHDKLRKLSVRDRILVSAVVIGSREISEVNARDLSKELTSIAIEVMVYMSMGMELPKELELDTLLGFYSTSR